MGGLNRTWSSLIVAAAILSCPAVRAQVETGPGTVVRGRVVTAGDNPRPLGGVLVESASLRDPVLTDTEGRFQVPAAARYSLTITKAGYAPRVVSGAEPATDERIIALVPGSVLTGTVVDASGFPVPDALVRARPVGAPPDVVQAMGVLDAETDEAGQFRIGSLPAGRYAINTELQFRRRVTDVAHALNHEMVMRELAPLMRRNAPAMSDVVTISVGPGEEAAATLVHQRPAVSDVDAPIAGAVSGSIVDGFGEPVQGVTVALWRLRFAGDRQQAFPTGVQRRSDDRGQYRIPAAPGRYLLVASLEESPYMPLYFPGVAAIAAAAPVVVGPRAEVHGIDVTFTRTRAARVTGRALDARGQPLVGLVVLTPRHAPPAPADQPRAVAVSGDATFEFTNLPPGDYVLRAMRGGAGEPVAEFTMRTITVGDVDPPAIVLATSPTASLRGRIVIDGPDIPAADLGLMALADADAGPLSGRPWPAFVTGDTFELRGLAGPTRISLSRAPAGYWLKSVDVAGVNAAITPVSIDGPDDSRADIVAVVSTMGGAVTGRVADEAGRPAESYRVVVFSTDNERWFAGSPALRITGGPEVDGTYTVRSLPPGDYWAVAVDTIDGDGDSGDWQNPDVLTRLAPLASRVSVAAGQRATVPLRLRQWGQ